jgi:hypothetical protein
MSEINYFKFFYYVRWCEPVACGRYKPTDDVASDNVDNLYIKRIIINDW